MSLFAILLVAQAAQAGGLSWKPPAGWTAEPPSSPMRVATYRIPATANGIRVTRVSAEGTFSSGMPGGPKTAKTHFSLLGAIAEGPGGNVFFKLTGPRKTVQKAASQFDALVRSLSRT